MTIVRRRLRCFGGEQYAGISFDRSKRMAVAQKALFGVAISRGPGEVAGGVIRDMPVTRNAAQDGTGASESRGATDKRDCLRDAFLPRLPEGPCIRLHPVLAVQDLALFPFLRSNDACSFFDDDELICGDSGKFFDGSVGPSHNEISGTRITQAKVQATVVHRIEAGLPVTSCACALPP